METISLRRMAITGFSLMILGFILGLIETLYFQSTYLPNSKIEFTYDLLSMMIVGMGSGLFLYSLWIKFYSDYIRLIAELKMKSNNIKNEENRG